MDVDSVDGMNKHIIDKMQKQKIQDELKDVIETEQRVKAASKIKDAIKRKLPLNTAEQRLQNDKLKYLKMVKDEQTAAMLDDTTRQYEQLSEQYAKTEAGKILKPKVKRTLENRDYNAAVEKMAAANVLSTKAKRAIYNQGYNAEVKNIHDTDVLKTKLKRLRNTQNKNAFENFASTLKEHKDWKIFKSLPKRVDVEAQGFDINRRNNILTKSLESDVKMRKILQKNENSVSNFGKLSSGVVKQQRQINKQIESSIKQKKQQNISNFGKLASQTKKIKEVRQNKQMQAAIKKYNTIGDMMATRNETPMVLGETAPSRFIQSAARLRKKALQSEISHVDTRVNLASRQEKEARIRQANLGIGRMDVIIKKKSPAGRPRSRSDQEAAVAAGSSRLSMLSTTSSQAAMTPKKK
jgi:hypothetical protein